LSYRIAANLDPSVLSWLVPIIIAKFGCFGLRAKAGSLCSMV